MKRKLLFLFGIIFSLILFIQGILNRDYIPVDIIGLITGNSSTLMGIMIYTLIIFMIKFLRFFVMPFSMIEKNPEINGSGGTLTVLGVFKFSTKVGSGSKMVKSFLAFFKEFFIWCFSGWSALMLIFLFSHYGLVSTKGPDFTRSVTDFYLSIYIIISLIDVYVIKTGNKIDQLAEKADEGPVENQISVADQSILISNALKNIPSGGLNKIIKISVVVFLVFIGIFISFFKIFDLKPTSPNINTGPAITQPLNVPDFKEDSVILISDIDVFGDEISEKRAWLQGVIEKQPTVDGQTNIYILKDGLRSIEFESAQTPEYQTLDYYSKFIGQNVRVHGIIHNIITYKSPDGRTQNSYTALEPIEEFIVN